MSEAKQAIRPNTMLEAPGDRYGSPCTYMLIEKNDVMVICAERESPPGRVFRVPIGELREPTGPNPLLLFYSPIGVSGLKWIIRLLMKYRPDLEWHK